MPTLLQRDSGAKKHEELEAQWRRRIEEGAWRPGERLPTFADLCDQHNVSRTTLERVCRSLEQDGLIVRRQGSGTYVAEVKPAVVATGFIGFSGHAFEAGPLPRYWAILQNGVQEAARNAKKGVVLLEHETFDGWDKVDGLVMGNAVLPSIHTQRLLSSLPKRMPLVSILFAVDGIASVVADDYQGGLLATQHLLDLGHRKIACMIDSYHPLAKKRYEAYHDAMRRAGIEPDPRWVRPYSSPGERVPFFLDRGAQLMAMWLEQDWRDLGCTAIVVQNDLIAVGVMMTLQQSGIAVPGQVSVVGFDNVDVCDYVSPRLTSVDVPLHRMGVMAAELLLQQIETGRRSSDSTTILPVQMRVRDSTANVPTGT